MLSRDELDRHWRKLEAEPTSKERSFRVADLPVETIHGPVAAAVDTAGSRHLLVPIESHQLVRKGMDGPVLQLRGRPLESANLYQNYADLTCLLGSFNGVFTTLCVDVLKEVSKFRSNPLKGLYTALDTWRTLLRTSGGPLTEPQAAGLFAELLVLQRMLSISSSAHRFWRGPTGHRHDFASAAVALEVKSSLATEGRRVRVHGLDQLDIPRGGSLQLAWFRLERLDSDGITLQQLVEAVLTAADDESAVLASLAEVGYRASDSAHYSEMRFMVSEERWYQVDSDFPRLTNQMLDSAGVPVSVQDVEYTIDLSSEQPAPVAEAEIRRHLYAMIEETV
ncbi:PD-(D/E)XK motif protein [Nocardia huaxiensis]|uniref:PD-(D/E)XK motif protein n=1 Tax=Nocardia huaxiensis TaxID=2755382 RepID=UPI001E56AE64|nr:PD-(D/E)XK motif protein [Nocardia huaxiensis]UFT00329.1 PD-(D/E)XK motif protein [Nocardia huaxiensis]